MPVGGLNSPLMTGTEMHSADELEDESVRQVQKMGKLRLILNDLSLLE